MAKRKYFNAIQDTIHFLWHFIVNGSLMNIYTNILKVTDINYMTHKQDNTKKKNCYINHSVVPYYAPSETFYS